jgi:hypothetical protein
MFPRQPEAIKNLPKGQPLYILASEEPSIFCENLADEIYESVACGHTLGGPTNSAEKSPPASSFR